MGRIARFKRIYIEITNACNLHCSFCQETLRPPVFMSADRFARVLEQVRPYTDYIYLHVKGEPLLHPQLEDLLKQCLDAHMTVNLTTNGTLLSRRLDILLRYPVHQLNISLHSAEDNGCIDIDSYIRALFSCCDILTARTETEISLRLWNTKENPGLFGRRNCQIKRHLYVNVQSPFEWPALDHPYCNERGFCQGLRQHMAILCDGTAVPCCLDGNAVMALGNVFETPLTDILGNARSTAIINGFRAKRAVEPLCMHCSFKERFSGKM